MQEIIYNNMHQFTSIGKWRVTDTQNKDLILLGIILLRCKTGTYIFIYRHKYAELLKKTYVIGLWQRGKLDSCSTSLPDAQQSGR